MSKLTAGQRAALPRSVFGLPASRGYPMPDAGHARFAMAMARKHATPEQQKAIFAKARRVLGRKA